MLERRKEKLTKKNQNDVDKTCKENPKKFWQFVNTKNKTSRSIGNITVTDSIRKLRVIENDLEKAEAFSVHFQKIFTDEPVFDLSEQIPLATIAGMKVVAFSEEAIRIIISKLKSNKSPGPDS